LKKEIELYPKPSELFEYAPDLILLFPPQLFRDGVVWREVAP